MSGKVSFFVLGGPYTIIFMIVFMWHIYDLCTFLPMYITVKINQKEEKDWRQQVSETLQRNHD